MGKTNFEILQHQQVDTTVDNGIQRLTCDEHIRLDRKIMSGTLISSLAWVPKGRAALQPKKYTLDDEEIERVGKLGGPGALEKLREEMENMDVEGGDWEE